MTLLAVVAFVTAYLIGSVDFAVIVSRLRGVDIYRVGSGNPGTANVLRSMGKGAASVVAIGDVAKGVVAATLGVALGGSEAAGFAAGFAAVVGHCYPVWHGFRGGKGVAVSGGLLLRMAPLVGLAMSVLWIVVLRITRIGSVASLVVTVAVPPTLMLAGVSWWSLLWVVLAAVLIIFRHRGNIGRLLRGEERKAIGA